DYYCSSYEGTNSFIF
nr:immunoglobulin light chain junction region [Macaca mulatta]MOV67328.1 immunoglobulin light chain junction region [Macaca mulatta]MOV67781.1 immunoglobulin light chain junction region [Macaca mulatta]MOV68275.1 immunoglobulin light chain junction region [Macaca mulatta]MOV70102.1 immunoglobulin light chain junction region [Macaca mulatta]